MKLQEALLCVDCEALFVIARACPQCGSQVSYPLSRALNRTAPPAGAVTGAWWRDAQARLKPVVRTVLGARPDPAAEGQAAASRS